MHVFCTLLFMDFVILVFLFIRNLKAVSASPRLVYPTHYTGEQGYISDTEDTNIIRPVLHQQIPSGHCLSQNSPNDLECSEGN